MQQVTIARRPMVVTATMAAIVLAAACGTTVPCPPAPVTAPERAQAAPSPTPIPRPHRQGTTPMPTAAVSAPPQAAKPSPVATPDPATQLRRVQRSMAALKAYQMEVSGSDAGKDGTQSTRSRVTIRYQAPGNYRFDVQSSTIPLAGGSRTLFVLGGSTVQVKAAGILGMVPLTLPLSDNRVASLNHWTPDKLLMHAVVDRAVASGGTVTAEGTAVVGQETVKVLKVLTPANALDPDIAFERIGYDGADHVRLWSCHAGSGSKVSGGLLYQSAIEQVMVDPTFAEGTFAL